MSDHTLRLNSDVTVEWEFPSSGTHYDDIKDGSSGDTPNVYYVACNKGEDIQYRR